VRELAVRRRFAFTDLSASDHLRYRLDGDLGPAGQQRPWSCEANRAFLDDGGTEDWITWTCPSLLAAGPDREFSVAFGGGGGEALSGGGDAVGDLLMVGIGTAVGLFRGRRREPSERTVTDVLAVSDVRDPIGVMADPHVAGLFRHWPVVDAPPQEWLRSVRRVLRVREYPPDAPPQPLALGMTTQGPLGVTTRDWWQRGPWLEHQIELGAALGRALVAIGAHA
jgi:hypothetical protein